MKKCLEVLAVLVVAGLVGVYPAMASGILDGKTFIGKIGEKGRPTLSVDDNFVFKNGKFTSTLCETFGYKDGAYRATAEGRSVNFEAQTTSAAGGKKDWKGVVKGDKIEGTVSNFENGKSNESWFNGTLKK